MKVLATNSTAMILMASACFMAGLLISNSSQPAVAATAQSAGGNYIINAANIGRGEAGLYVIDTTTSLMNLYSVERRSNNYTIRFRDQLNLANLATNAAKRFEDD